MLEAALYDIVSLVTSIQVGVCSHLPGMPDERLY